MKSVAASFVGAVLILVPLTASGQTSTNCPSPPGGVIRCESSQAAFCKVPSEQVEGACRNAPSSKSVEALVQWLMSESGLPRSEVTTQDGRARTSGSGRTPDGGRVSFALPAGISGRLEPADQTSSPVAVPISKIPSFEAMPSTCEACIGLRCRSATAVQEEQAKAAAINALCGLDRACITTATTSCR
jgi:hypothetical protein